MRELSIDLGPLADPLEMQLMAFGCQSANLLVWTKASESASRLHIHGFMTDSEVKKVRQRIFNCIKKSIEKRPRPHTRRKHEYVQIF